MLDVKEYEEIILGKTDFGLRKDIFSFIERIWKLAYSTIPQKTSNCCILAFELNDYQVEIIPIL